MILILGFEVKPCRLYRQRSLPIYNYAIYLLELPHQIGMDRYLKFAELWHSRERLDEAGWAGLYQVTHELLASCSVKSFVAELGDRKALIDDFFHDKIFMTAGSGGGVPFSGGALCQYFRRYLTDRTRNAWDAHRVSGDEAETIYENCDCEPEEDTDQILEEIGLKVSQVAESARGFLETLAESDRIYLFFSACADEAEALSSLAKRFRIPSYHHRAKRLGITREKGQLEAGYEETQIGGWLSRSLGIGITADHSREILAALKILCLVSLSELKDAYA